jgi:hypothetical protein
MTGQFHEQSFQARFGELGDTAETIFEQVWPYKVERYGLRRPAISMATLPEFVRFTPDFLSRSQLIEVQGFGRDGLVKLKIDKWHALKTWALFMPTVLFLYDSKKKRWGEISVDDLCIYIRQNDVTIDSFHDGNQFYSIPADSLPVEWHEVAGA